MKNELRHIILTYLTLISFVGYSQISPGELTTAHSDLEGMSKCTLCHDLGEKVSNTKCLDCHENIQNLINQKRGYHSSSEVIKEDCFKCHSEHHGRKFEMIRFDVDNFDHNLAGYELKGQHEVIDCNKCHVPDNIKDVTLKEKDKTFLGLEAACLSCHDDYHKENISSQDCISCHDFEAFSPIQNFDHDKTKYPLKGKHEVVDCNKCHEIENNNGEKIQKFNNLKFNDCKQCHTDPHNRQLKGDCKQCHTENSFATFIGKGNFNHNTTNFTLKGSHKTTDCFKCHDKSSDPKLVFQNILNVDENNCVSCHEDVHETKFGNDCATCHNEKSFLSLKSMDLFNHNVTNYPLEGKHLNVDCKQCHKERYTVDIKHSSCNSCHEDYHLGEFKKNDFTPDCIECHSLENGFEYSLFTVEKHDSTNFPLQGAHIATPCFACHVSEEEDRWKFKNIGTKCINCHEDIHVDYIDSKYYPDNNCNSCHINENWSAINFDHSTTNWVLQGKHLETDCRNCHIKSSKEDLFVQNFVNLSTDCVSCHENIHGDQFEENGVTECTKCHVFENWIPEKFDHNSTAFPLEGKHLDVTCNKCHISLNDEQNIITNYKIEKFQCIDCH